MKFKMTPLKVCAALILGIVTFSLTLSSLNAAVNDYEKRGITSCFHQRSSVAPVEVFDIAPTKLTTNEPLARLFQILFILFIISPPLMVFFLFLIWKELKERNRLK